MPLAMSLFQNFPSDPFVEYAEYYNETHKGLYTVDALARCTAFEDVEFARVVTNTALMVSVPLDEPVKDLSHYYDRMHKRVINNLGCIFFQNFEVMDRPMFNLIEHLNEATMDQIVHLSTLSASVMVPNLGPTPLWSSMFNAPPPDWFQEPIVEEFIDKGLLDQVMKQGYVYTRKSEYYFASSSPPSLSHLSHFAILDDRRRKWFRFLEQYDMPHGLYQVGPAAQAVIDVEKAPESKGVWSTATGLVSGLLNTPAKAEVLTDRINDILDENIPTFTEKMLEAKELLTKMTSVMEVFSAESVKETFESFKTTNSSVSDFLKWVKGILAGLNSPDTWIRYIIPVAAGILIYLIRGEKSYHLIPVLEGVAFAGVAYVGSSYLAPLLDLCAHMKDGFFQGPFGSFNEAVSKMLSGYYNCSMNFDRLSKILQNIPKDIDAVSRIGGMINAFFSYLKVRLYLAMGWDLKSGVISVDNAVVKTRKLVEELSSDSLPFTENTKMRVNELVAAIEHLMFDATRNKEHIVVGLLRDCLVQLRKVQLAVVNRTGRGFGTRHEPVFVVLHGKSGQGKTTAMTYLEKAIMRKIFEKDEASYNDYLENTRNFVYNVGPGMKHWEGVGNNAKLIKIDELFAEKEAIGMEASQSLLIQRLINTAEFAPLMAFEKKGMISLEPDFVLATTNVSSLRGSQTLEVKGAMRRRIHIQAEVTLSADVDPNSKYVDLSLLQFNMSTIDSNLSFVKTGLVLTLPELMEEIREQHELFLARQRISHQETAIHTDYILAGDPNPTVYLENLRKARLNYEQNQKNDYHREEGDDVWKDDADEREMFILTDPPTEDPNSEPDDNDCHTFRKKEYHQYKMPQHMVWSYVQSLRPEDILAMSQYGHLVVARTSHDFKSYWELSEGYDPKLDGLLERFDGKDRQSKAFCVFTKYIHFCSITKFGWSFPKFMAFFTRKDYIPLLGAKLYAFTCYVERFSLEATLDLFGAKKLMKQCSTFVRSLVQTVKDAVKSVVPEILLIIKIILMTTLVTMPLLRLILWVQGFFAKWVFQSDTQRKGHKTQHRNSRYNNRIREGNDQDWDRPDRATGEGDYGRGGFQVNSRVPEFLMNAQLGVHRNVYELTCPMFQGRMGYCLFLGGNDMLMPRHFMTALEAASSEVSDTSFHVIHFKQEGRDPISKTLDQITENSYSYGSNEYYLAEVDLGRQHKEITPHMADASVTNRFLIDFRNQFTVACTSGEMSWNGFPATYHPTVKLRMNDTGDFEKVHNTLKIEGIDTKGGDCGMLYFAMDGPAAGHVVGMHIGGGSNGGTGFAIYLNGNIVRNMRKQLHEGFEIPKIRTVLLDDIIPPARVSSGNSHIEFEGNGRIVEYSKKNVKISPKGIEKRLENYKDFEITAEISHIEDVCDIIGARYLSQMKRIPQRLSYHTAVFGEPGQVVATNFSTSAGIPLTGTELDKRYWRHLDGSPNIKVLDQIRVYLNQALVDIMRGVWPNFIFKIFPKDETLPAEDVDVKQKVRTINGGPIIFILLQKMYFGDLCALIEQRPLEFNTLIGLDMNSMDGHSLVLRLLEVNPERDSLFGGDISKFEFRQRAEVSTAVFDRIIEPLYANASPEERVIRRNLWEMGITTVNAFGDKLYLVHGPRASGEYMTSLGNTIYVQVALVYSYYKACGFVRTILPTFYLHVYCVSVGDDNIGAVSREVKDWFNQVAIRDGMQDLGLAYTDPNKGEIIDPFMKLDDIVMLQCQPRYDSLLGRWVWYQKLQTVLEMAQWTKKIHKRPDKTIWASNVLDSLRKLCLHPKSVWDEYIPKYQRMIAGYHIEVPTWDYRGMQKIVLDEAYMGVVFRNEIDAEQGEFQHGPRTRYRKGKEIAYDGFLVMFNLVLVVLFGYFVWPYLPQFGTILGWYIYSCWFLFVNCFIAGFWWKLVWG